MSSNKLIELSNLVFSVKEKLTDGEYKNMMDTLGEIHNININTININNNPPPQEVNINITDYKIDGVDDVSELKQHEIFESLTEEQKDYFKSLGFYHYNSDEFYDALDEHSDFIHIDLVDENYIYYDEAMKWVFNTLKDGYLNEEDFIEYFIKLVKNKDDNMKGLFYKLMKDSYIFDKIMNDLGYYDVEYLNERIEEAKEEQEIKAIEEVKEELLFYREMSEEERKRIKNNRECPNCHKKDYDRIITPEYICNICYEKLGD